MCLRISRWHHPFLKPKIARTDIPCYKVLLFNNVHGSNLKDTKFQGLELWRIETPQIRMLITQNTFYEGLIAEGYPSILELNNMYKENEVRQGAIHSFSYKKLKKLQILYSYNYVVLLAYIPKGTKYYIGKDGDYASEMIKFY